MRGQLVELVTLLATLFDDDGIHTWLTHPHKLLDGARAIDLCGTAEGRLRVLACAYALADGAFV